jgi:transcriptional regulator with XRE-family HTH domain
MTVYERVRFLRKNILNLNQEDFSQKINVSRSNLGNIEIGRINLTERVINDICREFSVNQGWLMNGAEPIFINHDSAISQITELSKTLNDDNRKYLQGYAARLLEEQTHENK